MRDARLVRGRWVITDAAGPVLTDAAVLVAGGEVAEVGAWPALRARHPAVAVLGGDRAAVLPGLIDAHHHAAGATALQQGVEDDFLEPWLLALACRRPSPRSLDTLLSAARLLRSGVTTVVDMPSGGGPATAFDAEMREALEAYDRAGLRVALAPGFAEQCHIVSGPGEEARFLTSLPADLRREAAALLPSPGSLEGDDYVAIVEDLWRAYRAHARIAVWFGPPGPQWTRDETWTRIAEAAARLDTGIQTHLVESYSEKLLGPRSHGKPALFHLRDLGVLSPRLSVAHGVWLTDAEIALLAEAGVAVVHNPSGNLRLRAGVAPVNALHLAGVTVGLGLDSHGLDDDDDVFREMRMALRLHRTPTFDGPAPGVEAVLGMATTGGARLVGAERRLGRLAPGYAADLVLLDLDRLTAPWTAPEVDPKGLLLMRAQARDVKTVLVAGEVVVEDGRVTRFDEAELARELADRLAAAPYPAALARTVERLRPHVIRHYLDWTRSGK